VSDRNPNRSDSGSLDLASGKLQAWSPLFEIPHPCVVEACQALARRLDTSFRWRAAFAEAGLT
jgi:hypothetical protein